MLNEKTMCQNTIIFTETMQHLINWHGRLNGQKRESNMKTVLLRTNRGYCIQDQNENGTLLNLAVPGSVEKDPLKVNIP